MSKKSEKEETANEENLVTHPIENEPLIHSFEDEYEPELIVSGAEYWDFDTNPNFIGQYQKELLAESGEKAGKIIGFIFAEYETGELHIISNSHQIEKALQSTSSKDPKKKILESDCLMEIIFKGKGETIEKKPFNKFKIIVHWSKNN